MESTCHFWLVLNFNPSPNHSLLTALNGNKFTGMVAEKNVPEWRTDEVCCLYSSNLNEMLYGSGHESAAVLLPGFAISW